MNINLVVLFFVVTLGLLMAGSILLLVYYLICSRLRRKGVQLDKPKFFFIQNSNEGHGLSVHNARIRDDNMTIFDAALSKEADFTQYPEGQEIIKIIRES
jgi:hypothetical protein